jgi:Phage integrase family
VPDKLSKILSRDLKMAGIPKRDDRGRTLDVHALRTTFGTLMSKGGVQPRTAQAAMRHSDIKLTMGVYTDPRLLDVRGALDALPTLRLNGPNRDRATGIAGTPAGLLAPLLAPTLDNLVQAMASPVKMAGKGRPTIPTSNLAVSGYAVNGNDPLTSAVSGSDRMSATGFEPVTPSVSSWCSSQLS